MDRHQEILRIVAEKHPKTDSKFTSQLLQKLLLVVERAKKGDKIGLSVDDNIHILPGKEPLAIDLETGIFLKLSTGGLMSAGTLWVIENKDANGTIASKTW